MKNLKKINFKLISFTSLGAILMFLIVVNIYSNTNISNLSTKIEGDIITAEEWNIIVNEANKINQNNIGDNLTIKELHINNHVGQNENFYLDNYDGHLRIIGVKNKYIHPHYGGLIIDDKIGIGANYGETASINAKLLVRNGDAIFGGYVGIGTTNPTERLHIKDGNLKIENGKLCIENVCLDENNLSNNTSGNNETIFKFKSVNKNYETTYNYTEKYLLNSSERFCDNGYKLVKCYLSNEPNNDSIKKVYITGENWCNIMYYNTGSTIPSVTVNLICINEKYMAKDTSIPSTNPISIPYSTPDSPPYSTPDSTSDPIPVSPIW